MIRKLIIFIFTLLLMNQLSYSLSSSQKKLKKWSLKFLKVKKKKVRIREKRFILDCSNVVRAIYFGALKKDLFKESVGENLFAKIRKEFPGESSGVLSLYVLFKKKYKVSESPRVGDIIFFDNTYDRNKNQIFDDILTHAGIVVGIDEEGTIEFVHGGTSKGFVVRGYANLKYKKKKIEGGKVINSYIQRKYYWSKKKLKIAGQLVRGFGRIDD